jgi:hypothetical protein
VGLFAYIYPGSPTKVKRYKDIIYAKTKEIASNTFRQGVALSCFVLLDRDSRISRALIMSLLTSSFNVLTLKAKITIKVSEKIKPIIEVPVDGSEYRIHQYKETTYEEIILSIKIVFVLPFFFDFLKYVSTITMTMAT